ncbi:hypothetical protein [Curtobacterium sp. MCPF17_052]|uniref:hypothetical protein n=1 Tax=Curtobacterium sp. MCPF17_052 TaxID=2175655 RepID=UPI0024E02F45|nr:hypothetical protein [Curtobacterium sp. MCPF17_052]WIB12345.1 hypothetical protein DEJ36_16825 [Curtobacterium sp. MCPF17_052]
MRTTVFDPPLDLDAHQLTRDLRDPSVLHGPTHKHREDLLDGVLCAWTASFWERHGDERVQVLGGDPGLPSDPLDGQGRLPALVAPRAPVAASRSLGWPGEHHDRTVAHRAGLVAHLPPATNPDPVRSAA